MKIKKLMILLKKEIKTVQAKLANDQEKIIAENIN